MLTPEEHLELGVMIRRVHLSWLSAATTIAATNEAHTLVGEYATSMVEAFEGVRSRLDLYALKEVLAAARDDDDDDDDDDDEPMSRCARMYYGPLARDASNLYPDVPGNDAFCALERALRQPEAAHSTQQQWSSAFSAALGALGESTRALIDRVDDVCRTHYATDLVLHDAARTAPRALARWHSVFSVDASNTSSTVN